MWNLSNFPNILTIRCSFESNVRWQKANKKQKRRQFGTMMQLQLYSNESIWMVNRTADWNDETLVMQIDNRHCVSLDSFDLVCFFFPYIKKTNTFHLLWKSINSVFDVYFRRLFAWHLHHSVSILFWSFYHSGQDFESCVMYSQNFFELLNNQCYNYNENNGVSRILEKKNHQIIIGCLTVHHQKKIMHMMLLFTSQSHYYTTQRKNFISSICLLVFQFSFDSTGFLCSEFWLFFDFFLLLVRAENSFSSVWL